MRWQLRVLLFQFYERCSAIRLFAGECVVTTQLRFMIILWGNIGQIGQSALFLSRSELFSYYSHRPLSLIVRDTNRISMHQKMHFSFILPCTRFTIGSFIFCSPSDRLSYFVRVSNVISHSCCKRCSEVCVCSAMHKTVISAIFVLQSWW